MIRGYYGWQKPPPGVQIDRLHWATDALIAHIPFNENGGGIANDAFAQTQHSLINSSWVPGAVRVGTGGYIDGGIMPRLVGVTAMSITMNVRLNTTPGQYALLARWEHVVESGFALQIPESATCRLQVFVASALFDPGANRGTTDLTTFFPSGEWVTVTVVYDGTAPDNPNRLKVYRNAVPCSLYFNGTIPPSLSSSSYPVTIGKFGSLDRNWPGDIEYLSIYTKALTAEQVETLYEQGPYCMFPMRSPVFYSIPAAGGGATVEPPVASSVAAMLAPTVAGGASVSGEIASSNAAMLAPTVTGGASVAAAIASSNAAMLAPTVTGDETSPDYSDAISYHAPYTAEVISSRLTADVADSRLKATLV